MFAFGERSWMAQFAPVAPLAIHKALAEKGKLGNYHLLLAHNILDDPVAHTQFWAHRGEAFIIMDNSLIELGRPLDASKVVEAAEMVNAQVVVLPDVLGDSKETLRLIKKDIGKIPRHFIRLGVVQGTTIEECLKMTTEMVHLGVDAISVPRHLTKKLGSRIPLINGIDLMYPSLKMHLLGFSDDILDDMVAAHMPNVWGIDSAVPIWYGLAYKRIGFYPWYRIAGKRPKDYWEQTELTFEAIYNISQVHQWLVPNKDITTPVGWYKWLSGAAPVPTAGEQSDHVATYQQRLSLLEKLQVPMNSEQDSHS
jgi:hypothetical protein